MDGAGAASSVVISAVDLAIAYRTERTNAQLLREAIFRAVPCLLIIQKSLELALQSHPFLRAVFYPIARMKLLDVCQLRYGDLCVRFEALLNDFREALKLAKIVIPEEKLRGDSCLNLTLEEVSNALTVKRFWRSILFSRMYVCICAARPFKFPLML
jgi:hypothetical protein